jgi:hypothetical protein
MAEKKRNRDFIALGILFSIGCLVRIDMIIFVAGYAAALYALRSRWQVTVKQISSLVLLPLLFSGIWLIFVYIFTGSLIPTGGSAYLHVWSPYSTAINVNRTVSLLVRFFLGIPPTNEERFLPAWYYDQARVLFVIFAIVAIGIVAALRSYFTRDAEGRRMLSRFLRPVTLPIGGIGALVLAYVLFSDAPFFFSRYFAVYAIFCLLFWVILVPLAVNGLRRGISRHRLFFFLTLIYIGFQPAVFILYNNMLARAKKFEYWETLMRINYVALPAEKVASYETGILAYYRDNVLNLDGKTNSAVLRAARQGTFVRYILDESPAYIVDRWGCTIGHATNGLSHPLGHQKDFRRHYVLIARGVPYIWKRVSPATEKNGAGL